MLTNNIPIIKAKMVVQEVKSKENIEVTNHQVTEIMKDEMSLSYRKTRKVPV